MKPRSAGEFKRSRGHEELQSGYADYHEDAVFIQCEKYAK